MGDLLHLLVDMALEADMRPRTWRVHPRVLAQLRVEVAAIHWSFVYNPGNPPSLLGLPIVSDVKVMGILLESDR